MFSSQYDVRNASSYEAEEGQKKYPSPPRWYRRDRRDRHRRDHRRGGRHRYDDSYDDSDYTEGGTYTTMTDTTAPIPTAHLDTLSMSEGERRRQRKLLELHQKPDGTVYLLDVYETRQQCGICSILFSLVQTMILGIMMWQCGVAPLQLNPMVGPMPDVLDYWGAKNTPKIIEDEEYWRLLTPMLLHAGVFHWIGNISVQLETGVFFEREWGSLNWLIIYLTSTVGSSVLSVIVMPQSLSVGSSGAVMGIMGAKLAEIFVRACEPNKTLQQRVGHVMRQHQCILAGGSVILVLAFSFIPYVDWAAHLGGTITGMTVGLMLFSCEVRSYCFKAIWFVTGLGLTIAGFQISFQYMYSGNVEIVDDLRNVCEYYQQMLGDNNYECTCTLDDYYNNNNNNVYDDDNYVDDNYDYGYYDDDIGGGGRQ